MNKTRAYTHESVFNGLPSLERHRTNIKKSRIDTRKAIFASTSKKSTELASIPLIFDGNSAEHFNKRLEVADEFCDQLEKCYTTGKALSILAPIDVCLFGVSNHNVVSGNPTIDGHDMFMLEAEPHSSELQFSCSLLREAWHSAKDAFDVNKVMTTFTITHQDGNTPANLERLQKLVCEQTSLVRRPNLCKMLWPGRNGWSRGTTRWINGWRVDPFEETAETRDLFLRVGDNILNQPTLGCILFFRHNHVHVNVAAGTVTASLPLINILPKTTLVKE